MKKILGLIIVLAVLVLGGYYAMGMATERTVKHNIEVINRSNGLHVKLIEYKRGWFTSLASLDWQLHVPERIVQTEDGQSQTVPAQDYEMQMPLSIYHGPVIFANKTVKFGLGYAHTDIPVPARYNEQFNANFIAGSVAPVLNLSLFVNYLNTSSIEAAIPAFKLVAKEGGQFKWMGMTSKMNVTSSADNISGEFSIDGMEFDKDDMKAVVGEISSDYDLHKTTDGLYLGDADLSFPSMLVDNKGKRIFELNSLNLHSNSDIKDGLFNTELKSSIEKIAVNEKVYGPGKLNIAIRNLDAEILGKINQQINKAQQGTELEKQQAMFALIPEFPKLFSKGPEFEISDLTLTLPQGALDGNLLITLPKGESSNPLEMIQRITGQGRLKIPAETVKMALDLSNRQKLQSQQTGTQSGQDQATSETAVSANAASGNQSSSADGSSAAASSTAPQDMEQQITSMTQTQMSSMVQSGLVVQDGAYLVIEVTFDQGKLMINGKPFDPAMLKF